ncbi:hypothetical protein N7524_009054 [Penicillium chrysogenum]|nr:hypothetical protein N7524_009054 [Penicillium chrysogenum]
MAEDSPSGCVACGWTTEQQDQCFYSSHVKLFYGASRRGVWSIGTDVIMKERPDKGPKTEVKTLNHLAKYPDIPAPKVLRDWVDGNRRYFVLQERIQGQTLEQAWPLLSESQKTAIADQVIEVRNQLRSITSGSIQSVDQSPCYPGLLFSDREPHGPFHSDLELWEAISRTLHAVPQRALEILKRDSLASWGWTEEDAEWKRLLQERLDVHGDRHTDAKDFWKDLRLLRKYPNLDEKGREIFEKLCLDER